MLEVGIKADNVPQKIARRIPDMQQSDMLNCASQRKSKMHTAKNR